MDSTGRFPQMTPLETSEIARLLAIAPPFIVWDASVPLQRFRDRLRGWNYAQEWLEEVLSQLVESIADYDSSDQFIIEYVNQLLNDMPDQPLPYTPAAVGQAVLELGREIRGCLMLMGLYEYKRSLLYDYDRVFNDSMILSRVSVYDPGVYDLNAVPATDGPMRWPIPNF